MSYVKPLRVADLSQSASTSFDVRPETNSLKALAAALGLNGLRKVRLVGEIRADGKKDWLLTARLGATVVQPCVITLDPVTTRIDSDVQRLFTADMVQPEGEEVEMPEDDDCEPLGDTIDLEQILAEELALALPAYPKADGAELGEYTVTEPGKSALSDDDVKPFAGLAALKDQLNKS